MEFVTIGVGKADRAIAMGQGNNALGVSPVGGKGQGITVVLLCRRTGTKVLPEGDHMKAMFMP